LVAAFEQQDVGFAGFSQRVRHTAPDRPATHDYDLRITYRIHY
jgi:hypothetical protein